MPSVRATLPTQVALLTLAFALSCADISTAQREGPGGLIRGLIEGIIPGDPKEIEAQAAAMREGTDALRLYGSLQVRFGDDPAIARAAIWVGLYYYGAGEEETALAYFERARRMAKDPDVAQRAAFWCGQARLLTGREPLAGEEQKNRQGFWGTLQELTGVDRSVREGRRAEAESRLLLIEGEARRSGLLGLDLARWGDLLRIPGSGRVSRANLDPLAKACAGLPERLRLPETVGAAEPRPVPEGWALQFGAFLQAENAERLREDLRRSQVDSRIDEEREGDRTWYRVRIGDLASRAAADSLAAALRLDGITYLIVRIR